MRYKFIAIALPVALLVMTVSAKANSIPGVADQDAQHMQAAAAKQSLDTNSEFRSNSLKQNSLPAQTATLTGFSIDQKVQNWVQIHRTNDSDNVARIGKKFGEVKYVLPTLGAVYLYGKNQHDTRLTNTMLLGVRSVLVAEGITQALKWTFHRHRPNSGKLANTWDGPSLSPNHVSFPSGHAATAFAWATVIASEYHDKPEIAALAYGSAALTAISRVNDNEHWLSDVLVGSAIGYYTAKGLMHRQKPAKSENIDAAAMRNIPLLAITITF